MNTSLDRCSSENRLSDALNRQLQPHNLLGRSCNSLLRSVGCAADRGVEEILVHECSHTTISLHLEYCKEIHCHLHLRSQDWLHGDHRNISDNLTGSEYIDLLLGRGRFGNLHTSVQSAGPPPHLSFVWKSQNYRRLAHYSFELQKLWDHQHRGSYSFRTMNMGVESTTTRSKEQLHNSQSAGHLRFEGPSSRRQLALQRPLHIPRTSCQ